MSIEQKKETLRTSVWRFVFNSKKFIRTCKKPSRTEVLALTKGHLAGLLVLGLFAYVVKLIHIPINNIITGS